jgi:hypothetical protein
MAACCDCSCGHTGIDPRSPCPAWLGRLLGVRIRSAVEAVMGPAFLRIYSREFCGRSRIQRLSGSRSSRLSWSRLYDVCTRRQTRTMQNPRFYRPERDFQSPRLEAGARSADQIAADEIFQGSEFKARPPSKMFATHLAKGRGCTHPRRGDAS